MNKSREDFRILFVTKYISGCLPGDFAYHGEWTSTYELILSLKKLNEDIQIYLITPKVRAEHTRRFQEEFGEPLAKIGVVHTFADTYLDYSLSPSLFRWRLFLKEKEIIKRFGISVIQYGQFGLTYTCLFKRGLGLGKIICYGCYETGPDWTGKSADRLYQKSMLSQSTAITRVQSLLLQIFMRIVRLKVFDKRIDHFVLRNPLGYPQLIKAHPSLNITLIPKGQSNPIAVFPREKKIPRNMLFLAYLQYRKGILDLLKIAEQRGDMDFNIVGSGDANIEALVRQYASKLSNVNYLGAVNYNEKWQVYQRNDILLHPSYRDTFPSAILEALSYGLPVITTYEIDSPITNGREGFLFQAGNLDQLAEKLNALRANPGLYHQMSKAALQTAKKYTWDSAAKQFLKLYFQ